jgi:hypothetical protein
MKTNRLKPIFAFLFVTFLLASCDREDAFNQGSEQEEEQVIESASVSEEASDDILEIASQAETELVASGGRANSELCASITHDKENNTVTIDFGDGCVGPYGRERKGKIIVL